MLVASFFHHSIEKNEVELLQLQKNVWEEPYIKKEKQYRECEHRGFLVKKLWHFLSEISSYALTYDKTFLQKRMLTMSEQMTCSGSDCFKKIPWTSFSVLWDEMG